MSKGNECPSCGAPLGRNAIRCRCGWQAAAGVAAQRETIPCAYSDCSTPALARVHTKTGWANVCERHYALTNFTRPIANSPVVREVLDAYAKAKAKKETVVEGEVLREPGQDEMETA